LLKQKCRRALFNYVFIHHTLSKAFKQFYPLILIAILGAVIYSNTFDSSFHFDDRGYIVQNNDIRDITNIKAILNAARHPSRFVTMYSFALNYHIHQLDVFGYHFVNLIIHLMVAMLVWWFVMLTLKTEIFEHNETVNKHRKMIALFAALLFVSHPIQTQAVTYITQRFASLAALFYLLSLCLYIKGRMSTKGAGYFIGSAIVALLGMFTKQNVITLPLAILLYDFCFFREGSQTIKLMHKSNRIYVFLISMFLLIIPALYSFKIFKILSAQGLSGSNDGDLLTIKTYCLTQFRVVATYIRLLFLPFGQNLDYHFPMSGSLWESATLLSFVFSLSGISVGHQVVFSIQIGCFRHILVFSDTCN